MKRHPPKSAQRPKKLRASAESSADRPAGNPDGERLQKVLANAGLGSRREIEAWISEGRIEVDGRTAELGQRITPEAVVIVDGKRVAKRRLENDQRYVIVYNKPEGEIVSRDDPEGRKTVFHRLPRLERGRWISIGRLDVNSAGLLLLTTDGELANRMMHPSHQIEREYAVRVLGQVTDEMLQQLVSGVELEDGPARCEEIVDSGGEGANRWFHLVIMEGRNREVRRLWDAVGVKVSRLKRVRFGPIILDSAVKSGQWRDLMPEERKALLKTAGLEEDKRWGSVSADQARKRGRSTASPPAPGSHNPWRERSTGKGKGRR
jgi:23S rRNA pseudouridine2605 synthase